MPNNVALQLNRPRFLLVAGALVIAGLLVGNASTSLWDQDESAYAGFGRTMLTTGDWVTPTFPYSQPHRKPPLLFWAIGGSFAALGINEFALRLPGVLSVLLSAILIATWGAFLVGRSAARVGGLVLASSVLVMTLGKVALVDAVLLLMQTIAALAMLRAIVAPGWKPTLVLWMAVAAGLLAKGPPILFLVGGMFITVLILHPRRWNLIHLHPWFGVPLALVPLGIWGWLSWQDDPRLVLFLVEWYVLRRVGGSVFGQFGLPGTHFILMFLCIMPWTPFLLPALKQAWDGLRRRRLGMVLLTAWLVGGWLLWEIPSSKLPTYPLGGYPAVALLIGFVICRRARRLEWARSRLLRFGAAVAACVAVGVAIAFAALSIAVGETWAKFAGFVPGVVLVAATFTANRRLAANNLAGGVKVAAIGALTANLLFWLIIVPGIEPSRGVTRRIAAFAAEHAETGSTVLVARRVLSPSLPFYVEERGLAFRDVLDTGPRPPLELDWTVLREKGARAFAERIKSQSPPKLPRAEEDALRLERARAAAVKSGTLTLVLDETQAEALRDVIETARVARFQGFLIDKLEWTTFVVAVLGDHAPGPGDKP